jgi:hypothetical protein
MRWHRRTALAGLAMVAAGLVGGVAVAAQTGTLRVAGGRDDGPDPAAVESASATSTPAAPASDAAPTTPNGQGPDATGPARYGLCNAYTSGQGTTNGGKADSVAFQALASAAGGAGNIAAYCASATPGGNAPHGQNSPPASTGGRTANQNASEHTNPTSDAHTPPADPASTGQSHRP